MTFKTRCSYSRGVVDPAPLVDVVFLLLIFFLLSSPYVLQMGSGISLPTSGSADRVSMQSMVLVVKSENLMLFNDHPVTLDLLQNVLQLAVKRAPNQDLIIKADTLVPHGVIVAVLEAASKAGVTTVNLATRPEVPTLPPPTPVTPLEPGSGGANPK